MKTSEILREAYERLTPERWFQGSVNGAVATEHPGYCAAIAVVGPSPTRVTPLQIDSACKALATANELPLRNDPWFTVVDWNNSPDTTFEDVKLGFKRAIAWAEERGE